MNQHELKNIIYFCIPENRPTGGIKYLLRHSHLINGMSQYNVASAIHVLNHPNFEPHWEVPHILKRDNRFNRFTDLIVLPEIMVAGAAPILQKNRVRYAILAQNGFYVAQGDVDMGQLAALYAGAIGIVSTSEEITSTLLALFPNSDAPIFNVNYAFDRDTFSGVADKRDLITYMPRKLPYHSQMVVRYLVAHSKSGWATEPIDGLSEADVVALPKTSKFFLSLSEMEGFGLPLVEAGSWATK